VIGEVLCERNDLERETQALTQGLQLLHGTTERQLVARGHTALARVQRAKGDIEGAFLTLQQGDEWLIRMQISAAVAHAWLAAQRAQLAIAQGNLTAALQWAQSIDLNEQGQLGYLQRLTLVRLYLAQYQREPQAHLLTEASQQLADLLGASERNGWMSHVL
jgi:hypothetical protein